MAMTNPYLDAPYGPVSEEHTFGPDALEVRGEIPRDLEGVYVRNGPNPRARPKGIYHWFDGDGMVHAVHLRDGQVTYRNRFVDTPGLRAETEAGRALWTGLVEPTAGNPGGAGYKDTGNTDVVFHNGELLALWYLCGEPFALDPITLETRGARDFGTGKGMRLSAHAKVDEATGELFFFEYDHAPPYMRYGVVGADGQLAHRIDVDLPGARYPHDMAITERHAILMDPPLITSEKAYAQGRWSVRFDRDLPFRFGLVPRRGEEVRWFEAEPCYVYHPINAWEDGDTVELIGCRVEDPFPPIRPEDGPLAPMLATLRLNATLHRWRFDLRTGQCHEERLDDRNTEFPTMAASHVARRSRYAYNVHIPDTSTLFFDGFVKYDLETGAATTFELGPGRYGSEAPFAPRVGATEEDDGYLLSFVHDLTTDRSELLILDARQMTEVARVLLPCRVPLGFHACWVGGEQLAS